MKITKQLEELGLNEKEAQVYVAILEIGGGTAFRLADEAKLPKSTTFDMLKRLAKMGLVSSYMRGSKKIFSPTDPAILKERLDRQVTALDEVLPKLKASYNIKAKKPRVRYYEGSNGLGIAFKEFLSEADSLISIAPSLHEIEDKLPEYFPKVINERIKRGIHSRAICVDNDEAHAHDDTKSLRRMKYINKKYDLSPVVWLWKDKVMFANTKGKLSTVVIEDHEIANFIRTTFEYMWDHEN